MEPNKRIKVLFITKWFMNRRDPQLGVFIRKHASAAALYCDVSLLCVVGDAGQLKGVEFEEKAEYGVRSLVVYFRKFSAPVPMLGSVINFFRYARATRAGLKRIEKTAGQHDITHAYILLRPALTAWWLRLTKGIPFIISEQWSGYATGKFSNKNFFEKFLCRAIFRKANAVTAVSAFLAAKMQQAGLMNNYTITPNVVEPVERKKSPLPVNDKIKILTVADLVDEIKNISGTLRAIAEISRTSPDIEFHIVGHGKDEVMLKNLAKELGLLDRIVFFHGVKANEEVFQYLHACNFLVMNSWFETFSLVCIEAMSCGKPVIATRCGGPEEFINEHNGILINPGNSTDLLNAIEKMISGDVKYDSLYLREFALNHFSIERAGKIFSGLYQFVLKK